MGRPEKEGRCRKHPIHKNSNGVCPYCLRDRLANISGSSSSSRNNPDSSTSSVSSTAYSSYDSDVSSSAGRSYEERERRSLFQLLRGRKRVLKSSLSFNLGKEREKVDGKGEEEESKMKKGGGKVWVKFVMRGGLGKKKDEGGGRSTLSHSKTVKEKGGGRSTLSHSKTLKEKPSSKWSLFS
ncbi:uncharacterized protein LOC110026048 [Phalaenopsis equestris]|uniref:uncharacterized protein LOC110026048 n=1 Tax=Phalaenopsis equestris TaxID=78828 RepID=UPI0009E42F59|nr:uncharacterized protein LOC110026048 [Phalaenopsis equestris]